MMVLTFCSLQLILLFHFGAASPTLSRNSGTTSECSADKYDHWGYRGEKAPKYWNFIGYPACSGTNQSPIDIDTNDAKLDASLTTLDLNIYDIPIDTAKIENNGHTIQVTPKDDGVRSINVEGSTYIFQQFHLHWGDVYSQGSEHTVDGTQYAMEIHFVHTNANNEIAVVGAFFQEVDDNNEELQKIVEVLPELLYKGSETELSGVNLNNLLPNDHSYYRYDGSLTTPQCSEGVKWSVMPDLLYVGKAQVAEFRKLYSTKQDNIKDDKDEKACRLSNNFRPVQPLNYRNVTKYSAQ